MKDKLTLAVAFEILVGWSGVAVLSYFVGQFGLVPFSTKNWMQLRGRMLTLDADSAWFVSRECSRVLPYIFIINIIFPACGFHLLLAK